MEGREREGKLKFSLSNHSLRREIPDRLSWEAEFDKAPIQKPVENAAEDFVIVIVDDDESVRKALKRLIKTVGLNVEDFASAEEFLCSGQSQNAACLILDLRLPGMSGLELQNQLGAANRRVPIIFISAHGDGQERTRAVAAGAVDFLQKPFGEDALFKAIISALVIYGDNDSHRSDGDRSA
jgi:FixJ family two-component response regulator